MASSSSVWVSCTFTPVMVRSVSLVLTREMEPQQTTAISSDRRNTNLLLSISEREDFPLNASNNFIVPISFADRSLAGNDALLLRRDVVERIRFTA